MKQLIKPLLIGLVVFLLFPMPMHYRGEYKTSPPIQNASYCNASLDYTNCLERRMLVTENGGIYVTNVLLATTVDEDTKAYFAGDIPDKEFSYTPTAAMLLPLAASFVAIFLVIRQRSKVKKPSQPTIKNKKQ